MHQDDLTISEEIVAMRCEFDLGFTQIPREKAAAPINFLGTAIAIRATDIIDLHTIRRPGALVDVLRELPENFTIPVSIVIHISEPFGAAFAEWLNDQTPHDVCIASDGQLLNRPGVFIAPSNQHLVVRDRKLRLTNDLERHSCRPSVDVLFESVALEYGSSAAGCLLTGMGQDGARGLLAMLNAGGTTIAQDEATCIVYGMPHEAALLGAAQHILPLPEIGPTLAALAPLVTVAATN